MNIYDENEFAPFVHDSVAILIPCHNEAASIGKVVKDCRASLPYAKIYVYDNASDDNTSEIAKKAGAIVMKFPDKGKGNVTRKMFSDIEADIYVMIDGDATYSIKDAIPMIKLMLKEKTDMVVAVRNAKSVNSYPAFHAFGNKIFNLILKLLFNSNFRDIFSGFRVFSRRFVKTFPITSNGFDIEAELSIHAFSISIPCSEFESDYFERGKNSYSKLHTMKDGAKILWSIIRLFKDIRPFYFFGLISFIFLLISLVLAYPIIQEFLQTGLVPRIPTAILSMGLATISFSSFICGIICSGLSKIRLDVRRIAFMGMK